ncbi:MAG: hypothetical protein WBV11_15155 [Salegentibacter sp.]
MPNKSLVLISKIIFFYSIFYVVMKLLAMLQGAWIIPNLILTLPYLVFAAVGGYMLKSGKFYWLYVVAGILVITVVRYFEKDWMLALHQYFG